RRNADRRKVLVAMPAGTAAPGAPGAHLSAFHRGSGLGDRTPLPGFSSALPGMGPVSGRYPQTDPSQYSEAPRRPVVVPVGRVPEAARERVANPPAGAALAPCCGLPAAAPPIGRGSRVYVTGTGTIVNENETKYLSFCVDGPSGFPTRQCPKTLRLTR